MWASHLGWAAVLIVEMKQRGEFKRNLPHLSPCLLVSGRSQSPFGKPLEIWQLAQTRLLPSCSDLEEQDPGWLSLKPCPH